jgi:hypothetical protein
MRYLLLFAGDQVAFNAMQPADAPWSKWEPWMKPWSLLEPGRPAAAWKYGGSWSEAKVTSASEPGLPATVEATHS